jgi:predicted RNase H-like nuclease (RuvC/YqgF family)
MLSVEQIHSSLEKIVEPYLSRISELESSVEKKDTEIVVLKHALENLQRIVEEGKKVIKKER